MSDRLTRRHIWCALLISLTAATAHGHFSFRKVAITGDPAPGTDASVTFSGVTSYHAPVVNAAGQTAFKGMLAGPNVTTANDTGIWSEGPGSLTLVAREGTQPPGTATGVSYNNIEYPILNNAGRVAFAGTLIGSGVTTANNQGLWTNRSGSVELLVRKGDPAPGTDPGVNFGTVSWGRFGIFNEAGRVAFKAGLAGSGVTTANDNGIWSDASGTLTLIAREGSQAPGTDPGITFSSFTSPVMNNDGRIAFRGTLTGTGVDASNDTGIWVEGPTGLNLFAREGQPAPGTVPGALFGDFYMLYKPAVNSSGQIVFTTELTDPGVDPPYAAGIWAGTESSLRLVARTGQQAPGTPASVTFIDMTEPLAINDAGQVAFWTYLDGPGVNYDNDTGLWLERDGGLHLIARAGDPAPGTGPEVVFDFINTFTLNDYGQVAFQGILRGPGVSSANSDGLWVTDPTGVPTLVVREGDLFEVSPGISKTIKTVYIFTPDTMVGTGNADGKPSAFEGSRLVLWASFTDGSTGAFVADNCNFCPAFFGDMDDDDDVDQTDFGLLQTCLTGPGPLALTLQCTCADRQEDADIDDDDVAAFQTCLQGADTPPNPACRR